MGNRKGLYLYLAILVLGVFFLLSFTNVSAISSWLFYGGNNQQLNDYQSGTGLFNGSFDTQSLTVGFNSTAGNPEPLITDFGGGTTSYIIFPSGNNLEVYDGNLNLMNEFTINQVAQAPLSTDNGYIAGIWKTNASMLNFRLYEYNPAIRTLNLIKQNNISFAGASDVGGTGLRCFSGSYCDALLWGLFGAGNYSQYYFKLLNDGSLTYNLINSSNTQPQQTINGIDANNDGINEFISVSSDKVIIFNENGADLKEWNNATYGNIQSARWVKTDASPLYRIVINHINANGINGAPICTGGGQYNCWKIEVVKLDGTQLWLSSIGSTSSGDYIETSKPAIADLNGDGIQDLFFIVNDIGANEFTKYYVFKSSDGTILYNKQAPYNLTTTTGTSVNTMSSIANLESTANSYSFVSFGNNIFLAYSIKTNTTLVYSTGLASNKHYCISADTNHDNGLGIVCLGQTETKLYVSYNAGGVINSTSTVNNTYIERGYVNFPTQLVDPNDENNGLLPQIWTGFIAILSHVWLPILIIFLLIVAIGTIVIISHKIGSLGGR